MNIDLILTEWCFRLPKGYPTSAKDYKILYDVLLETANISSNQAQQIVERAQRLNELPADSASQGTQQEDNYSIIKQIKSIGLPDEVNTQIFSVYKSLSDDQKHNFNKNFRVHSIDSFVQDGWKAFQDFFLVNVGGARGGMGNGEVSILLGVKDSKPGGTEYHDIVMPNGQWEVKELEKGKFDPAKEGAATKFKLTGQIQEFYKDIVLPFKTIGDPYTYLKHMVSPQSAESLKKLIMIFETRFIESIEGDKLSAGMEWKKSAFYNWYEGFKELHEIFYQTELDTDVRDTRLTVAAGGETQSYWISDDDAEKIKLGAGEENPTGVRIGEPIDNINTNAVLWFKRVERNLFIKEPREFISELTAIKENFFKEILGLIYYNKRNPQPHIANPEAFVIDSLSQGRYRFVLRSVPASQNYPYLQQQG
jgi:hypothetical protein